MPLTKSDWLVASIEEAHFSSDHRYLYDAISEVSEDWFCASWLRGCEYAVWKAMTDGTAPGCIIDDTDAESLALCQRLSDKTGGWIVWLDDDEGPRFVPLDAWIDHLNTQGPNQ